MKYIIIPALFLFLTMVLILRDSREDCVQMTDRCKVLIENSQNYDLINICLDKVEKVCNNE